MYTAKIKRHLGTLSCGIEISKEDFEHLFVRTKERIEFIFIGWDGKSYNGETRIARVLRINLPGCESVRFIKVGKAVHMVLEDSLLVEKETGIAHNEVIWMIDVARR